jgi:transcription initiation factor TFIID subunit 9B
VGRGLNHSHLQQDAATNTTTTTGQAGQMIGGVKLPPEKYCLTGVGWGLREEWDSEGEEDVVQIPEGGNGYGGDGAGEFGDEGTGMGDGDEEEEGRMEDIFGDDGGGGGGGEDEDMQDD